MWILRAVVLVTLVAQSFVISVPTTAAAPPANDAFQRLWDRTDLPVSEGTVVRTWVWGPEGYSGPIQERYVETTDFEREVQYFDKSRMEITNPDGDPDDPWYVTNGLLAIELMTGRLQFGDSAFLQLDPAEVNVAGDPDDPTGPTYRTFAGLMNLDATDLGTAYVYRIDRDGNRIEDPSLADYGIAAAEFDEVTEHSIATPFWDLMNETGLVYQDGNLVEGPLVQNPVFAVGRPVTEAYWARVKVNDVYQDVLTQCFERRCLTYTPGNEDQWQVEAGNIGQHYFRWRYEAGHIYEIVVVEGGSEQQLTLDGLELTFSAGAIDGTGLLALSRHSQLPPTPDEYRSVGNVYSISLSGANVADTIEVSLPYDSALIPDDVSEEHLVVGRYDEETEDWDLLTGSASDGQISVATDTFSTWTVLSPESGDEPSDPPPSDGDPPDEPTDPPPPDEPPVDEPDLQAPIAQSQQVNATGGIPVDITLHAIDPDSDSLTFSVISGPSNGSLNTNSPSADCSSIGSGVACTATVAYTADQGFNGSDQFTFTASDGNLLDAGIVSINVTSASTAESTLSADPVEIAADGSSTSLITVVLYDNDGNELGTSGGTVSLASDLGSLSDVDDHGDGTYTSTLTAPTEIGEATITGEINDMPMDATATVTFVAGEPTTIEMVSGDGGTTEVGTSRTLTVRVTDQFENPVSEHSVDWEVESGGGAVSSDSTETDDEGLASVEWTLGTSVGTQQASAISADLDGSPVQFTAEAIAGPAEALEVTTQPSGTAQSGAVFTVQPVVQLIDAYGNNVSEAEVEITASLESGDGTLSGTVEVETNDAGEAVFTDLAIDGLEGEYQLIFEAESLDSATSELIELEAGEATHLAITTQPSSSASNDEPFDTQPVIQLRDSGGNDAEQEDVPVTVSLEDGDGEINGTLSVDTDEHGEAEFDDLSIIGTVGQYTLLFESPDLESVTSEPIALGAGDPESLELSTQPSEEARSGEALETQPVIQLYDSGGNVIEQEGIVVTASIEVGDGDLSPDPAEATTNESGQASFSGLTITGTVGDYVLLFEAENLNSVTSSTITLSAGDASQLVLKTQPSGTAQAGVAFPTQPEIQLQDSTGNDVRQSNVSITVEIETGDGDLEGTLSVDTSNQGIATFTDLRFDGSTGERTLTFDAEGLSEVTSDPIQVEPGPASPEESTITANPTEIPADGESQSSIVVQLVDQFGNDLTESGGTVVLSTEAGTLSDVDDLEDGSYSATLTSSEDIETATITGTLDGDAIADSATVAFVPGEPAAFEVSADSYAVLAGENVTITAQIVDETGHAVSLDQVTVSWSSTAGGEFASATSDTNESGEATVTFTTSETVGITHVVTATATIESESIEGESGDILTEGPPEAADYGPVEGSSPGDPFHIETGGTYSMEAPGLFTDSNPGEPEATIESFSVGDSDYTPSDNPVDLGDDGSLTVRADGSFSYEPDSEFLGVFTFTYTLENEHGDSTGTVTIFVGDGPEANDATYEHSVLGNVMIDTSTATPFSITDNDEGDDLTVSLVSSPHGDVDLNPDGTFTFNPNAGARGEVSFTYEVSNALGSDQATVTLNIDTVIWFVDNNTGSCDEDCDGRLSHPFTSLSSFQSINDGGAGNAQAGDIVFIHQSDTDHNGSVTLLDGQHLIGQDASASIEDIAELSLAPHSVSLPETDSENDDNVTLSAADNVIQLGQNNVLHGFTIDNTSGTAISGSSIGNLEIDDVTIATNGQALDLSNGTISASFDSISSGGGTHGIRLVSLNSGSLTVDGGTIQNSTSSGIRMNLVSAGVTLNDVTIRNTGGHGIDAEGIGSLSLVDSLLENNGDAAGEHGINLAGVVSALSLDNTTVRNAAEDLIHADSTSTVSITVENGSSFEHPQSKGSATNSALTLLPRSSASFNVSVEESTFTNIALHSLDLHPQGNASGIQTVTFSNNSVTVDEQFNELCSQEPECRASNVSIHTGTGSAQINLTIEANTFTRATGPGVIFMRGRGTSTLEARILDNEISGGLAHGIDIDQHEDSELVIEIDNNTINDVTGDGILASGGEPTTGYSGSISVAITNNTIAGHNPDGFHASGITVARFGNVGQNVCLALTGNSVSGGGDHNWIVDVSIWGNLSDAWDDGSVVITYEGSSTGEVTAARVRQDNPGVDTVDIFDTVLSNGQLCQRPGF